MKHELMVQSELTCFLTLILENALSFTVTLCIAKGKCVGQLVLPLTINSNHCSSSSPVVGASPATEEVVELEAVTAMKFSGFFVGVL